METLGPSSGVSPLLRPTIALQGDLAALLREGRVLAGEVLERLGGGTYVIGVAGRRVPAQSPSELEVGSKLEVEVARAEDGPVLRVLSRERDGRQAPRQDPALLRVLRGLANVDPDVAEVLEELGRVLRRSLSARGGGGTGALDSLLTALAGRLLEPDDVAVSLRGVIEPEGLAGRAALLAALAEGGSDSLARALRSLATQLATSLARGPHQGSATGPLPMDAQGVEMIRSALSQALRVLIQGPALQGERPNSDWVANFEREWERALRAGRRDPRRAALLRALEGRAAGARRPGLDLAFLRALFLAQEMPGGAGLAQQVRSQAMRGMGGDLEGRILEALLELPAGTVREAALRALASLDLEHVLNLARAAESEPLHWSFLLPDGAGGHTPLELFLVRREGRRESEAVPPWQLTVGVEFSALGPVRADLYFSEGRLSTRLMVSRPEVAARFSKHLDKLRAELGDAIGARSERLPVVTVVVTSRERASVRDLARQTRLLADHHLMDELG